MIKEINKYYRLFPGDIYKIDNGYYFYINDYKYYILKYDNINNLDYYEKIVNDLYSNNIMVHTLQKTIYNNSYINYNNMNFVLLKVNSIEKDLIKLDEIIKFNKMSSKKDNNINLTNWNVIWSNKVDIFEMEMNDLNKEYKLLQDVFNYYIGLSENAIIYARDTYLLEPNINIGVGHRRIRSNMNRGYFYNPLTFTYDFIVRDFAEYTKFNFFDNTLTFSEIEYVINSDVFTKGDLMLYFARLLYPSYFFDLTEAILSGKKDEEDLKKIINKVDEYEDLLIDIFFLIKKKYDIPPINWLMKK